jgi:glycosyltransferase involved in cell wall biosynthesis
VTFSPRTTSLSVLVPVYNEQYLVSASLLRVNALAESSLLSRIQVIVVDDCSTDPTPTVLANFQQTLQASAASNPAKIDWQFHRHERNQGKGGAIQTALEHAECELTVIHDADLEYHPRDLLQMIPLFMEEGADAVFGSRFLAGGFKRALFFRHSLGNHLLTFLCDMACDLNLTDMETCYKMLRTDLFRSLPLTSRDFRIEPEITIKLAKRGARIFEVPISYSGRTYQEGKKIGWKDGVKALTAILRFQLSDNVFKPDAYGSNVSERLRRAPRYTKWIADTLRPFVGNRVLELGAGVGTLTLNLVPRAEYSAADPNPLFVRELRKLNDTRPYLHAVQIDPAESFSSELSGQFDTVICQNVLEHVVDDEAALLNCAAILAPGGLIVALVPRNRRLFGRFDDFLGHRRRYNPTDLSALAQRAGLEVVQLKGVNRAGSFAWWVNSRLLRRRNVSLFQMRVLNLLVPLLRRIDRMIPLPPLTAIAVLAKPSADTADQQPSHLSR